MDIFNAAFNLAISSEVNESMSKYEEDLARGYKPQFHQAYLAHRNNPESGAAAYLDSLKEDPNFSEEDVAEVEWYAQSVFKMCKIADLLADEEAKAN